LKTWIIKIRKLLNGSTVSEFDEAVDLIIHTKAPGKYKIVDLETGEEYIGSEIKNESFAPVLIEKVNRGKIGQWIKIKAKQSIDQAK
jgi:hypothetical protein